MLSFRRNIISYCLPFCDVNNHWCSLPRSINSVGVAKCWCSNSTVYLLECFCNFTLYPLLGYPVELFLSGIQEKKCLFFPPLFTSFENNVQFSSVPQSCPTLWPHGLQHARHPCPSPTPGVYSNSCPLSRWCHPTISSSVVPFSSHLQSFPASGSFPMSQFFMSGGQSIDISASASVLPMNIQDWFPLISSSESIQYFNVFLNHEFKY